MQGRLNIVITILVSLMVTNLLPLHLAPTVNYSYEFEPSPYYIQSDIKAVLKINSTLPYPQIEFQDPQGEYATCHPTGESGCTTHIVYGSDGYPLQATGEFYISGQQRSSGTYTAIATYCSSLIGTLCSWRSEMFRANFYIDVGAISGNVGTASATLSYIDGISKTVTADGNGNYSITFSPNWSGTVTPSKTGYIFSPVSKSYANLIMNQTDQSYIATQVKLLYLSLLKMP